MKKLCKYCSMYIKDRACTLVKGDIDPDGTCKYWERGRQQKYKKPTISKKEAKYKE